MTPSDTFERRLADWMADEASDRPADHVVDGFFANTRRASQAPAFVARLQEPGMWWHRRPVAGTSRRQLALIGVVLLLALAALAAFVGSRLLERPPTGDWLGYRGGPGRDGAGLVGPVGRPVMHWQFDAGAPVREDIAIVGDIVIIPGQDGVVHGVRLSDGKPVWEFPTGTSISGPTADGDTVYIADGRGIVHALDIATGTEQWHSSDIVPAVSGIVTGDGGVYVGAGGGLVVALDAGTGEVRWRSTIAEGAVHVPAFADGSVVVATDDGKFIALRASDGSRLWSVDIGTDPSGTPTLAGGIAYLGATSDKPGGRLRAVDARTGILLWQVDEPLYAPAVAGDLAVSGSSSGVVSARDTGNRAELWRVVRDGAIGGLAIVGDTVYYTTGAGNRIEAVDKASGRLLWTFDLDGTDQCCLAVAKGYVVAGTMTGFVDVIGGDGSAITARASSGPVSASHAPSAARSAPTATPSALPDPFTVVARINPAERGIDRPLSLAAGPSGDIYVADRSSRVTRLSADGQFVGQWGEEGQGAGQFDFVPAQSNENMHASIGVGPDGTVYVSDSDNHRIQVFTASGDYLGQFGSPGSDPGQFTIPFDVSADAEGNVYVTDDGLQRVTKFSPAGAFLWLADGDTDPLLAGHAHDADLDTDGRIVLIIDDLGKVIFLSPDGDVVDAFDAPGCDVTMDGSGRYFVTDCKNTTVTVYDAEGRVVGQHLSAGLLAPQFLPDGRAAALTTDGSIVLLRVDPPAP